MIGFGKSVAHVDEGVENALALFGEHAAAILASKEYWDQWRDFGCVAVHPETGKIFVTDTCHGFQEPGRSLRRLVPSLARQALAAAKKVAAIDASINVLIGHRGFASAYSRDFDAPCVNLAFRAAVALPGAVGLRHECRSIFFQSEERDVGNYGLTPILLNEMARFAAGMANGERRFFVNGAVVANELPRSDGAAGMGRDLAERLLSILNNAAYTKRLVVTRIGQSLAVELEWPPFEEGAVPFVCHVATVMIDA
jgi:hypothetical protein